MHGVAEHFGLHFQGHTLVHANCDLRRDLACVTLSLSTSEANMGPPNKYAPSCTFPYGPVFVLLVPKDIFEVVTGVIVKENQLSYPMCDLESESFDCSLR